MADKRDYYEILGLTKSAGEDDIKKAFRKLAKENHPDLHPGDKAAEERFKEINEAYEVLSDPDKKSKYDRFGFAGVDPNYAASGGGTGGFSGGFDDFGDIFSTIFGGGFGGGGGNGARGAGRAVPRKGESIRYGVTVSFEEAAFGCEKKVSLSRVENCPDCGGNGCQPGTTPEICPECKGSGTVRKQQSMLGFAMQTTIECPRCGGKGKIIHQPCRTCKGSGTIRTQKTVNVKIPKGIDHHQTISLSGEGHAGQNGGPNGDLLITVAIKPHDIFTRDGTNVYSQTDISVTQAMLGDEIEVPTLDGKVKYTIPEGTQSGEVFRLRGKGIPYLNSDARGDQYVTVKVNIPKTLTREQRELVEQLSELLDGKAPGKGIFRNRFKK